MHPTICLSRSGKMFHLFATSVIIYTNKGTQFSECVSIWTQNDMTHKLEGGSTMLRETPRFTDVQKVFKGENLPKGLWEILKQPNKE